MFLPILWCILCFWAGMSTGKTIDMQYRDPEGKPVFVSVPQMIRPYFRFSNYDRVVQQGLIVQIISYIYSLLELLSFFLVYATNSKAYLTAGNWLMCSFGIILAFPVLLPFSIKYERNIQKAYDSDWITYLQRSLTLLPKRKCRVTAQIDFDKYEITLGFWGIKRHCAKANFPVEIGDRLYAVHSVESGSPFWTIKDH